MHILNICTLLLLAVIFYLNPFDVPEGITIYLTISSFLFAIFTGFFISRQAKRHSSIRDLIARFDGNMSFLYRSLGTFGSQVQTQVATILRTHYKREIKSGKWDYNLLHKTTVLTDLQHLLENTGKKKAASTLTVPTLQCALLALKDQQVLRKELVALHKERIPASQWGILYLLGLMLVLVVALLPAHQDVLQALLKSAFLHLVLFIFYLLHQLDSLTFFEKAVGMQTAQDLLDIIAGKK